MAKGRILMTMALCFTCGHVKFGAIVACPECRINSTGDMGLDILFSDHHMAESTLAQFGQIVKLINRNTEDPQVRFWTFMHYVTLNHSDLLSAGLPEEIAEQVKSVYASLEFPPVEILPGRRGPAANAKRERPPSQNGPPQKRWWHFGR